MNIINVTTTLTLTIAPYYVHCPFGLATRFNIEDVFDTKTQINVNNNMLVYAGRKIPHESRQTKSLEFG